LHDSGWGPSDAVAIVESRGKTTTAPLSFLQVNMDATVAAWTGSIDIAARIGPLAGYLVSRHFLAILDQSQDPRAALATNFRAQENARQQRLRGKIQLAAGAIERLLEALQFCDLLSLYLCCGLQQSVEFPQKANGQEIRLLRDAPESCRLQPNPLSDGETFSISAIRHPRLKGNAPNSAMFALIVE